MAAGRVLVTGGTGHLGYHLIHELNAAGTVPRVLLRRPVAPADWDGLQVSPWEGDLEEGEATLDASLRTALKGIETVYHLAACTSLRPADAQKVDRVNRIGTMRLAEAAARAGTRRIVHVSTSASVGISPDRFPLDETASFNLQDLRVPYIHSKRAAESWLLQNAGRPGFPEVVVANPSLLVGPPLAVGNRGLRRALTPWSGWFHFSIEGRINIVDVRDVARALVVLAERGRNGERYLLTGPTVTISEMLDTAAEFLPLGRLRLRLPRRLLALGAALWSAGDLIRLLGYGWEYSCEKARHEIGFAPTPLRESLRHLAGFARALTTTR